MGDTFSEERWNELMSRFRDEQLWETRKLPDFFKRILEMLEMLKREVAYAHERFKDYELAE